MTKPPHGDKVITRLWERLDPIPSERVVLSAVYQRHQNDRLELRYGSLLVGPAAMSRVGWSDWQRLHGASEAGLLPRGDPSEFAHDEGDWLAGRAVLTLANARRFLEGALLNGTARQVRGLPEAEVALNMATSPFLTRHPNPTRASGYVMNTVRPVHGFFFPSDADDSGLKLPEWWPTSDSSVVVPPSTPLGIDAPAEGDYPRSVPHPDPGLVFGRVSRTAWINSVRYDRASELFIVGIWTDQADLHSLVVEVREYAAGELAFTMRIPLADIYIPSRARHRVDLALPTLGRRLERSLSLYDRDGTLLDTHSRFRLAESIHLTIQTNGGETSFVVGEKRPPVLIAERLDAFDRVESDYLDLLRSGVSRRVVETRAPAVRYLRQRLRTARDEVLIIDPYFGKQQADWELLSGVSVPVRVLRGPEKVVVPASLPNVTALRFRALGAPIPFHDRFYLWGQTGLTVGTSPNGFGNRVFRIDEIGRVESDKWRSLFERWWVGNDFGP